MTSTVPWWRMRQDRSCSGALQNRVTEKWRKLYEYERRDHLLKTSVKPDRTLVVVIQVWFYVIRCMFNAIFTFKGHLFSLWQQSGSCPPPVTPICLRRKGSQGRAFFRPLPGSEHPKEVPIVMMASVPMAICLLGFGQMPAYFSLHDDAVTIR